MKLFLTIIIPAALLLQQKCSSETQTNTCYKGRLEIKGMCANYTISLRDGAMDPSKIEAKWTDEQTNKAYTNVFALGSPCNFPETIQEGQEFYFTLDSTAQDCMVCQAYYPKPSKALAIKVLDKPCR